MCTLLSQIIKSYSSSPYFNTPPPIHSEDESENEEEEKRTTAVDPIKRAEEFLDQYEDLRSNRVELVDNFLQNLEEQELLKQAMEQDVKKEKDEMQQQQQQAGGLVDSVKNFFFGSSSNHTEQELEIKDENEEELEGINAHCHEKYMPNINLYTFIIKNVTKRTVPRGRFTSHLDYTNDAVHDVNESSSSAKKETQMAETAAVTSLRLLSKMKKRSHHKPIPNKVYGDVIKACAKVGTFSFAKLGEKLLREMMQQQQQEDEFVMEDYQEEDYTETEESETETEEEESDGSLPRRGKQRRKSSRRFNKRAHQQGRRKRRASFSKKASSTEEGKDGTTTSETKKEKEATATAAAEDDPITLPTQQQHHHHLISNYNQVMKGYKNAISYKSNTSRTNKQKAVQAVERLFYEDILKRSSDDNNNNNDDDDGKTIQPNVTTYNTLLSTWCNAGQDIVPDICEKADSLLIEMIGGDEEAFRALVGEEDLFRKQQQKELEPMEQGSEEEEKEKKQEKKKKRVIKPDMIMLHYLIEIYAPTNERKYVNRSIYLLQEMERRRSKALEKALEEEQKQASTSSQDKQQRRLSFGKRYNHLRHSAAAAAAAVAGSAAELRGESVNRNDLFFPTTTTYNHFLLGLLRCRKDDNESYGNIYNWRSLNTRDDKESDKEDEDEDEDDNIILGERGEKSVVEEKQNQTLQDAMYASTHLLDSMISHKSSLPNQRTFTMLIKLWNKSKSPLAGEKAEELLSRMEVLSCAHYHDDDEDEAQRNDSLSTFPNMGEENVGYSSSGTGGGEGDSSSGIKSSSLSSSILNPLQPNAYIYRLVMDCWELSARKGQPGAAKSALALLDRAEAQCRHIFPLDVTSPLRPPPDTAETTATGGTPPSVILNKNNFMTAQNFYNEAVRPNHHVYTSLIKVCSHTKNKKDKSEALKIGFDVYNRMIDHGVQPTASSYAHLLGCCANLIISKELSLSSSYYNASSSSSLSSRNRMELAETVFEAACHQGQVNDFVLKNLKRANYPLFESYAPSPDHSARVGRTSGTTIR